MRLKNEAAIKYALELTNKAIEHGVLTFTTTDTTEMAEGVYNFADTLFKKFTAEE